MPTHIIIILYVYLNLLNIFFYLIHDNNPDIRNCVKVNFMFDSVDGIFNLAFPFLFRMSYRSTEHRHLISSAIRKKREISQIGNFIGEETATKQTQKMYSD